MLSSFRVTVTCNSAHCLDSACKHNEERLNMHGEFNLYQKNYCCHLIHCTYNVDTLNICIKKFDALKLSFDKMAAS